MAMPKKEKSSCKKIIHTASVAAAAIGGGLAQLPGADTVPITAIQIGMIISLGGVFGIEITKSAATSILAGAAASISGRATSQFLLGWIPGFGNALNAATAAGITESIGWLVAYNFAEEAQQESNSEDEESKSEQKLTEAKE